MPIDTRALGVIHLGHAVGRSGPRKETVSLIALILTVLSFVVGPAQAAEILPACQTEDEAGFCYWDASERGNGEGVSFYVIDGLVTYLG